MDIATIIGIIAGVVCLLGSIAWGGPLKPFWDAPSVICVVGGGISAAFITHKITEIKPIMKVVMKAFTSREESQIDIIRKLVELSMKARRDGLLSLEAEQEKIEDEFLKASLQLVIDGVEPDIIIDSMDLEIENMKARHDKGAGFFKTLAAQFPAWGMIGTLVGLINLLRGLDDPSNIGPAMAIAIITTFYGSVLANFVCNPIAEKLAINSAEEIRMREMMMEGVLSIQSGENPRLMEHKLKTFLSPAQQIEYEALVRGNQEGSEAVSV